MRRQAFTFGQVLICILLIGVIVVILYPACAPVRTTPHRRSPLSEARQHATAVFMYLDHYDDHYPLAFGRDEAGNWRYDYYHYVPAKWPSGSGGDSRYSVRRQVSRYSWANSLFQFSKMYPALLTADVPQHSVAASMAEAGDSVPPADVSYTFNGLLHGYPYPLVSSPSHLPVIWSGLGRINVKGAALSNPALSCPQARTSCRYVPSRKGCSSHRNGQQSVMFTLRASMWTYSKGATFAFADGHAKFRRLGAPGGARDTEPSLDPYTGYNDQGFPRFFWWDGCHPWFFRPDYAFNK